jgi:hypothetical protein
MMLRPILKKRRVRRAKVKDQLKTLLENRELNKLLESLINNTLKLLNHQVWDRAITINLTYSMILRYSIKCPSIQVIQYTNNQIIPNIFRLLIIKPESIPSIITITNLINLKILEKKDNLKDKVWITVVS